LNITEFVSAAVCGDDVEHEKPAPDLIKLAAERLMATDPERVWAVGDTPYDAAAALAAGIRPIGTLGGGFSAAKLKKAGCVDVVSNLGELLPCLRACITGVRGPGGKRGHSSTAGERQRQRAFAR
jgi:phosphoglycolate phosphatase-like HAD superfamily hydrolase